MSYWTYVNGTVTVRPMGSTQAEKRYILETVLNHLPIVSGSENGMSVHIVQKSGHSSSSSCDEFGENTNNLLNNRGYKSQRYGWLKVQDKYILVVEGTLRDREFEQTYREFIKWICRLAKRIDVEDVLVEIKGYDESSIIRNTNVQRKKYNWHTVFGEMYEKPTWCYDDDEMHEPNWCEYLRWDRAKNSWLPMKLAYKYYADKDNDEEVERRMKYERR